MMKYRKRKTLRIAYGFLGRTQDEIEILQGFQGVSDQEGWQVIVLHEQFEMQLRELIDKNLVDAVVGDFISERWLESLPSDLLIVHRGSEPLGPSTYSVSTDLKQMIHMAEDHFKEMGYASSVYYSPRRMEGVEWVRNRESLRECLLKQKNTGVMCVSDFLARQGIQLARQLGLRVPEDVGFVGIGDRRLDRLLADSDISSFPKPNREIGKTAAQLIKDQIERHNPKQILLSPGALLSRESSRKEHQKQNLKSRVDKLIALGLADPPPVSDWAKQVGMSRRSFENAFSEQVGMTPYAYLMHLRIQEAKRLLKETDSTVAKVGLAIGIPDPPRFSAFFRKATGTTASEWRKNEPYLPESFLHEIG